MRHIFKLYKTSKDFKNQKPYCELFTNTTESQRVRLKTSLSGHL